MDETKVEKLLLDTARVISVMAEARKRYSREIAPRFSSLNYFSIGEVDISRIIAWSFMSALVSYF